MSSDICQVSATYLLYVNKLREKNLWIFVGCNLFIIESLTKINQPFWTALSGEVDILKSPESVNMRSHKYRKSPIIPPGGGGGGEGVLNRDGGAY